MQNSIPLVELRLREVKITEAADDNESAKVVVLTYIIVCITVAL